MSSIFLLSPARSDGKRAAILTHPDASFKLARQVQIGAASVGDVFTFCSGLYFRGKLAYARRFADPPESDSGVYIITPSRGLVAADTLVGTRELAEFASVPVDSSERRFTAPLREAALRLAAGKTVAVVLLGSVATGKYIDTLLPIFGDQLHFPEEFMGRGDMSRGALLLRAVAAHVELRYRPVSATVGTHRRAQRDNVS